MDELSEETREQYRRWWSSRSPEDRARLRAMNGRPVTIHELVFLGDSEGFPLATSPGERIDPLAALHPSPGDAPTVFCLPDFLTDEGDDASPGRPAGPPS